MLINGVDVDVTRSDIPGNGCIQEGCPLVKTRGVNRCGDCGCVLAMMRRTGKNCPVAARRGEVEHSGIYGRFAGDSDD